MATRKEIAASRARGARGRFVKSSDNPVAKFNLPSNILPDPVFSHLATFQALPLIPTRVYKNTDEALRADPINARAMRRDTFILRLLFSRQMAVAQLPWDVVPEDPRDPFQVYAANFITRIIEDIPRFVEYKRNLLEAIWTGRSMMVNNFGFDWVNGLRRMVVKDWTPVMGDKIQFRIDSDEVGYLVNPAKLSGVRPMEISYDGPIEMFSGTDRKCVVVHKHFIMDAHYAEGEFAGGIHGVGLRSFIYWAWLHKQELLAWVFNALEMFSAGGLKVYYFEAGNPESYNAVKAVAEQQTQSSVLLFPRPIGVEKQGPGLEIMEPKGAGFDIFMQLIDEYFDKQIRQLIIGESSEDHGKSGLGGMGEATVRNEQTSFQRIVQYDADNLAETLNRDLVSVLQAYNFPGSKFRLKLKYNLLKPDPQKMLEAAQRFFEIGGSVKERELRSYIGLSEPEPGDVILKKDMSADQTIKQPRKNIGSLGEQLS
jgi:phage gp29-like protein